MEDNISATSIKIKKLMIRKGMNARMLASQADVGRSFVYDVLNGKAVNPSSKKLQAITNVLDVSLSYLINCENNLEGVIVMIIKPLKIVIRLLKLSSKTIIVKRYFRVRDRITIEDDYHFLSYPSSWMNELTFGSTRCTDGQ
ncbi:uncharacterized protein BX664DRAFT_385502 [Halteromyces radiatus]|uniref:uncharacterized protein n=1 Tax=Halteromyces radiatus TaxID=101107 RepID=UPI00221F0BE6|nr:uncharacterized protein BX664DRAFT_385502 [Halteromyces radiatus]KAI8088923.1 hypothetical protein BX664DRAFT_385502 [Halteromyces radiatus]